KNNFRQIFAGMQQYHERHNRFPDVTAESGPRNVAGMVMPILADAVELPPQTLPGCPSAGEYGASNFTLAQLRSMSDSEFNRHASNLIPCYAYCLGFRA